MSKVCLFLVALSFATCFGAPEPEPVKFEQQLREPVIQINAPDCSLLIIKHDTEYVVIGCKIGQPSPFREEEW